MSAETYGSVALVTDRGLTILQHEAYFDVSCTECLRTVHFTGTGAGWGCTGCGASWKEPDKWGMSSTRMIWDGEAVIMNNLMEWISEWARVPVGSLSIDFDRSVELAF